MAEKDDGVRAVVIRLTESVAVYRKEVHGLNDARPLILLCRRAFERHGTAEGEAYGADLPFSMGVGLSQGRAELRY